MTNQLIPPLELDHPLPKGLSHEQLVALWLDGIEASDELLLAGLKATLPPGSDLDTAYREWYEQYSRDHYEMLMRMAERFQQLQAKHVGDKKAPPT